MSFAIIPGNLSIIWWIYTVNLSDSHICFSRYELYPGYDSCFSQILTAGDSTMKKRYGGMAGVKPIYQVVGGGIPQSPSTWGNPGWFYTFIDDRVCIQVTWSCEQSTCFMGKMICFTSLFVFPIVKEINILNCFISTNVKFQIL